MCPQEKIRRGCRDLAEETLVVAEGEPTSAARALWEERKKVCGAALWQKRGAPFAEEEGQKNAPWGEKEKGRLESEEARGGEERRRAPLEKEEKGSPEGERRPFFGGTRPRPWGRKKKALP